MKEYVKPQVESANIILSNLICTSNLIEPGKGEKQWGSCPARKMYV